MSNSLTTALVEQLAELRRWFEGRLVPEPGPSDEVVPAERYLDLDFLRAAIARAASTQPPAEHYVGELEMAEDEADIDLRIAVSRFTRQYASSISAVALVALARGVGLDLSAPRCNMIVRSNIPFLVSPNIREYEALRCAERPTTMPASGPIVGSVAELRGCVWRKLYAENFAPLFERARKVTKVSPRLMWTNAAEWVGLVSDAADEYLSPRAAAPFVDDRIGILDAPSLPGVAGPNPLKGLLEWSDPTSDLPHGQHVRDVCCVTFYLPDRLGRLCESCPFLPAEDRLALVRERHGVPMGTPGGPAERRAIAVGLDKLRFPSAPHRQTLLS
jgi:ferric iron reductase protein FhuF